MLCVYVEKDRFRSIYMRAINKKAVEKLKCHIWFFSQISSSFQGLNVYWNMYQHSGVKTEINIYCVIIWRFVYACVSLYLNFLNKIVVKIYSNSMWFRLMLFTMSHTTICLSLSNDESRIFPLYFSKWFSPFIDIQFFTYFHWTF